MELTNNDIGKMFVTRGGVAVELRRWVGTFWLFKIEVPDEDENLVTIGLQADGTAYSPAVQVTGLLHRPRPEYDLIRRFDSIPPVKTKRKNKWVPPLDELPRRLLLDEG
jgi:hypothetical protein